MQELVLKDEALKEFLHYLERGNYIETSLNLVGLTRQAWRKYVNHAKYGEEPYTTIVVAARKAIAKAEADGLVTIRNAEAEGDWKAAAWRMERRGGRWGNKSTVNLKHSGTVAVNVDHKLLQDPDARAEAYQLLLEKAKKAKERERKAIEEGRALPSENQEE